MNYYSNHIEYINPDKYKKGYRRRIIVITIIAVAEILFLGIGLYVAIMAKQAFLIIAMLLLPFVIVPPLFWFANDTYRLFNTLLTSLQYTGKIVINNEYIAIINRGHLIRQLNWIDVAVIEKSREDNEKIITIITNKMKDRIVLCSHKKKNFIQIPYRPSLEMAIKKYTGRDITLADPNVNRFALQNYV